MLEIKKYEDGIMSVINENEIKSLCSEANITINDVESAEHSNMLKHKIKRYRLRIEDTRKAITQPLYDLKKDIDTMAKKYIEPLESAEYKINKEQIRYNNEVQKAMAEKQKEIDELVKASNDNQAIEAGEVEKQTIQMEAHRQTIQKGINYNKKIIKVDRDKLPRPYWNIKEMEIVPMVKEIKKAMQMGIKIDGITFEE